ncbi:MAG: NAD(P)-binding domain-containing protein, partial [Planctomycetota bacterium]
MANVAVLGTGLLGSGMVENLLGKGHSVRVWNRTRAKLEPLVQKGAVAADDPAAAVAACERVHLVLTSDDAVDQVVAQMRSSLGKDVPVLDHSTNLPARVAERTAVLRSQGVRYVSAPVFMSPKNARDGSGMIVLAGDRAECDALMPVLQQMTGKVLYVGERSDLAAFHKISGNGLLI